MDSSRLHPWRNNAVARSPLQQSFPMQETPSRPSREPQGRKRGESRSSSVPSTVRNLPTEQHLDDGGRRAQSRTQPHSRATSTHPHSHGHSRSGSGPAGPATSNNSRRSVKHLTCFWWKSKNHCRFSEEECLYAHHDTGHYTLAPKQVVPGEPAKAGKSLELALRELERKRHSDGSFSPANNATYDPPSSASSKPVTPSIGRSRATTPSPMGSGPTENLRSDNNLVQQTLTETLREHWALSEANEDLHKAVNQLQDRIIQLQKQNEINQNRWIAEHAERNKLVAERNTLISERDNLLDERQKWINLERDYLAERGVLKATVRSLQYSGTPTQARFPAYGPQTSPWGAVGRPASFHAMDTSQPRSVSANAAFTTFQRHWDTNNTSPAVFTPTTSYAVDFDALQPDNSTPPEEVESEEVDSVLRNLGPTF